MKKQLDEMYRTAGWGRITDAAFEGKVEPSDVEGSARTVARYAYEEIRRLQAENQELRKKTVHGY